MLNFHMKKKSLLTGNGGICVIDPVFLDERDKRFRLGLTETATMQEAFNPNKNPVTAFWDFYAMYFLWFKIEGWRDSYVSGTITFEKRVEYIRNVFWSTLVNQASYLLKGMFKFIPEEFDNIYDEYLVGPESVKKWGYDNRTVYNKILALAPVDSKLASPYMKIEADDVIQKGAKFWELLTVPEVSRVFSAPFWREDSDLYGGEPWAVITNRFGKLLEAFKRKNINALAMEVDHTYDLDHNTGSISSKFPAGRRVGSDVLDHRAAIRSMDDFLPLVSPAIEALLKRSIELKESVSIGMIRDAMGAITEPEEEITLVEILLINNPSQN